MDKIGRCSHEPVVVKHTTNECLSMIKEIKYKIDINTLHRIEDINSIEMNDIVIYIVKLLNHCFTALTKKIDKLVARF